MCFSFVFSNCISSMWECWNVSLINKEGLSRKEDYPSLNDTSSYMLFTARFNQPSVPFIIFNIKITPSWNGLSLIINVTPKTKTLRFEKMRSYKGQSENEHLHWFRDVVIRFLNSPEYFITNQIKIKFYITSLKNNPNIQ